MNPEDPPPEDMLLAFHMDQLTAADRVIVESEIDRDAERRRQHANLTRLLRLLDAWDVDPPPADLVDNTLAAVRRSTAVGAIDRASGWTAPPSDAQAARGPEPVSTHGHRSRHPSPEHQHVPRRWVFPYPRLRESLAVAACIAILILAGAPWLSRVREHSRRAVCANHLGSIYRGVAAYRASFGGSIPYAGPLTGTSWLPNARTDRPYASNSRHLFKILQNGYGPVGSDFICPADRDASALMVKDCSALDDFQRSANVSYHSLNLAGVNPILKPASRSAYVSDPNPLFDHGRCNLQVSPSANSRAHRGDGQTVLLLNGEVLWVTSPILGPSGDNIWLVRDIRHYTGTESPEEQDDVQLIPGYPESTSHATRPAHPGR